MTVQETEQPATRDELPEKRETPSGTLYRPRATGLQVLYLLAVFAAGPGVGWVLAVSLGGLSENARFFLCVPFFAILFLGYGLWSVRLKAIAFQTLGKGILRALFFLIVRRKKPQSLADVLPTPDKLEAMAVRGQKAASSFCLVAVPVAAVSGAITALIDSDSEPATAVAAVIATCLLWGALLTFLGRRGFLPMLEGK